MRTVQLQLGEKTYEMPTGFEVDFPREADPVLIGLSCKDGKPPELTSKQIVQILYSGVRAGGYKGTEDAFKAELNALSRTDAYVAANSYIFACISGGPAKPIVATPKKRAATK